MPSSKDCKSPRMHIQEFNLSTNQQYLELPLIVGSRDVSAISNSAPRRLFQFLTPKLFRPHYDSSNLKKIYHAYSVLYFSVFPKENLKRCQQKRFTSSFVMTVMTVTEPQNCFALEDAKSISWNTHHVKHLFWPLLRQVHDADSHCSYCGNSINHKRVF